MDVDITSMKIDLMNVKFEVCKCNQLGKGSKKRKKSDIYHLGGERGGSARVNYHFLFFCS